MCSSLLMTAPSDPTVSGERSAQRRPAPQSPDYRHLVAFRRRSPGKLEKVARGDSRVLLLRSSAGLGDVDAYNRGLAERVADVVLLRSDIEVTPGWLDELADVVYSEQRTACVSPLINHDGYCSVPVHDSGEHFEVRDEATVRTPVRSCHAGALYLSLSGVCCYLRGDVIDAVGRLDTAIRP